MKTKIVYILHSIEIGGVEVALLSAIPKLVETFDLKVVVIGHINYSLLKHLTAQQQSVFTSFNYPNYLLPFKAGTIVREVERFNPKLVICSLWKSSMLGLKLKKKLSSCKFISFIHSTGFPHYLVKYFNTRFARAADLVLTDSISTLEFVRQNFDTSRPIEHVSLLTNSTPESIITRKIDRAGKIKFLFLGRIMPVKNLPLIIRFLSKLKEMKYHIQLDVYGRKDVGYEAALEEVEKLNMENQVFFRGSIDPNEKFNLFNDYHFLIQFSSYEGMAMSVAESMQYGLPPIVTPVGEIPNYAKNRISAIFVDISHEEGLMDGLNRVIQVIENPIDYSELCINSNKAFKDYPIFSKSLIEKISNLL